MKREVPGEAQYRVTFPLVLAKTFSGVVHCYRGEPLPANTLPAQVEHLLAMGAVEPIEPTAGA